MGPKSGFNLRTILQYLLGGPGHIRQVLSEQGPTAASRSARYYSMALCLIALAVYFLFACAWGFFHMRTDTPAGLLDLTNPNVLAGVLVTGLVDLAAMLAAAWAGALAIMALFNPEEPKGPAFNALMWGVAMVIIYGGVFAGLLGYTS